MEVGSQNESNLFTFAIGTIGDKADDFFYIEASHSAKDLHKITSDG